MLPQSQNENLQPPKIISMTEPDPRVEPVFQPLRVQTQESATTPPPRYQPYTSPSLDTHSNLQTKTFTKYKKIPQILKTRKTQAAPRQVQHQLSRPPRNFGTNFRTQAEQHLVANNLFKLSHDLHIYNKNC